MEEQHDLVDLVVRRAGAPFSRDVARSLLGTNSHLQHLSAAARIGSGRLGALTQLSVRASNEALKASTLMTRGITADDGRLCRGGNRRTRRQILATAQ
jgi:hypothetical protein